MIDESKPLADKIDQVSSLFNETKKGFALFSTNCKICDHLIFGYPERQFFDKCIMHAVNSHSKEVTELKN